MNDPTPSRPSAASAVSDSFGVGWDRMVHLLFRGPGANVRCWAVWGAILLVAGMTVANFGGNWRFPGREREELSLPGLDAIEPWMIIAGLAALVLLVLLGFVWLYFMARFRFVMLEGVRVGLPRIRGVYGSTRRVGGHYFVFMLALSIVNLLLLAPIVVPWIPVIKRALQGDIDPLSDLLLLLIVTGLWIVALALSAAVVNWWVYDLALPYVWLGRTEFRAGLGRAWRLTKQRPDAVLAFFLLRILVAVAGLCAGCVLGCVSCVLWILPVLIVVAAVLASMAFPPLWILSGPLILVLALIVAWISATVTAPIPLFYRAWSCAFVHRLDPSLPLWDDPGAGGGVMR